MFKISVPAITQRGQHKHAERFPLRYILGYYTTFLGDTVHPRSCLEVLPRQTHYIHSKILEPETLIDIVYREKILTNIV